MDKKILMAEILVGILAGFTFAYFYPGQRIYDRDTLLKELELGIRHEIERKLRLLHQSSV